MLRCEGDPGLFDRASGRASALASIVRTRRGIAALAESSSSSGFVETAESAPGRLFCAGPITPSRRAAVRQSLARSRACLSH